VRIRFNGLLMHWISLMWPISIAFSKNVRGKPQKIFAQRWEKSKN